MAVFRPPAFLETVWGAPNSPPAAAAECGSSRNKADMAMIIKSFVRCAPFRSIYFWGKAAGSAAALSAPGLNSRDLARRAFTPFKRYWM